MKRYAVATINFFDNILKIEFTEANTWKEALDICYHLDGYYLPDDIEEAKAEAFNGDWMFDVKET
jgi:hypothetical protein